MTNPNDNYSMTKEEKIREDYFGMEKEYWTPFGDEFFQIAAEIARREARRIEEERKDEDR